MFLALSDTRLGASVAYRTQTPMDEMTDSNKDSVILIELSWYAKAPQGLRCDYSQLCLVRCPCHAVTIIQVHRCVLCMWSMI
jgi:hypothetical protein